MQTSQSGSGIMEAAPKPLRSTPSAPPHDLVAFDSDVGGVHLTYSDGVSVTREGPRSYFSQGGWRLFWGPPDPFKGKGQTLIHLSRQARPESGAGSVTEHLQVGLSRDAKVVTGCLTDGLHSGNGRSLPDRRTNGRTFVAFKNGDNAMSQSIEATDLRAVVANACYAIDRYSTAVKAGGQPPTGMISQDGASETLDATLASLRIDP